MSPAADSAGQPFEGRSFHANPFSGDEGLADPALVAALSHFWHLLDDGSGQRTMSALDHAFVEVVEAVRGARLLSPLIAEAGDFGLTDAGLVVEKTQELSVVHLESPDGRAVAPVFMDVASMGAWRSDARPIPVDARKAAIAALSDGLSLMVLNPGTAHPVTLRRGVLHALASGETYSPAWLDAEILNAISQGIAAAGPLVVKHRVVPGDPGHSLAGPELIIALGLENGLTAHDINRVVANISEAWTQMDVLSRRVDGLGIKVVPV